MADQSNAELFDIRLEGEGITVSKKIRPEVARAVINIVMGASSSYTLATSGEEAGGAASIPASHLLPPGERVSLREYLDESEATHNPDKILVIGSYLIDHERLPDFSREDIKSRFRTAGEAPPANYPRDFANAVRLGWIAEDHQNRSRFFVTQKGRTVITAKFSADVKKPVKPRPARRNRKRLEGEPQGGDE